MGGEGRGEGEREGGKDFNFLILFVSSSLYAA